MGADLCHPSVSGLLTKVTEHSHDHHFYLTSKVTGSNYDSATASLYFGGITVIAGITGTVLGAVLSKVWSY